jgi:hypothetical protein
MRELVDGTFTLPLSGFAESYNLSVATAITFSASERRQSEQRSLCVLETQMNTSTIVCSSGACSASRKTVAFAVLRRYRAARRIRSGIMCAVCAAKTVSREFTETARRLPPINTLDKAFPSSKVKAVRSRVSASGTFVRDLVGK